MSIKVFNEDLTEELNRFELDLTKGYLRYYKGILPKSADEINEFEDCMIYHPYTPEQLEQQRLNILRDERTPLLAAFDKWEKAVLRGRENEDTVVMEWYKALLDLNEQALENIPERIKYYL